MQRKHNRRLLRRPTRTTWRQHHGHCRHPAGGESGRRIAAAVPQNHLETDPVSLPVLPGGLPRSHQRRAGQAADGRRAAAERSGLWSGRRAVLRRLYSVRGAEQPDPAARRRQDVDCPYHDHLGAAVHRHHVRHHADPVLRHSLSAWRGGGRFPARRALLPDAVVPDLSPRPHHRAVHDRPAALQRDRRAALRLDHGPFRHAPRAARLAVAVFAGGHSQRAVGRADLLAIA